MAGFSQNVDERVINKLCELVSEGVQNVRDMAQQIRIYVKNDLFRSSSTPPSANRRFDPTFKDVRFDLQIFPQNKHTKGLKYMR